MVQFAQLFNDLHDVLQIKYKDLKNQGVENVSAESIWQYFLDKKWQGFSAEDLQLHQMVSDLFALSKENYVNYQQQVYESVENNILELNENEIASLLED